MSEDNKESGQPRADSGTREPQTDVYATLEQLPRHLIGEVIAGELFVRGLPTPVFSRPALLLFWALAPFDLPPEGKGAGCWVLLLKGPLHLGADVLVPNIVGWRRERMPELPDVVGATLAPDWVCEVLSPSTESLGRGLKMEVYAREGVKHLWFVDPRIQTLELYRLKGEGWEQLGVYTGNAVVHAEPFEALPLSLASLWRR